MTVRLELRCDAGSPVCRTAAGHSPTRDALSSATVGVVMAQLARDAGEAGWVRLRQRGWVCPECAEVRR